MYKCHHKDAPNYLSSRITRVDEVHMYSTRSRNNALYIPKPRIEKFKNSFSFYGPKLYNQIPNLVKSVNNISSFKHKYKQYFFSV